MHSCTADCGAGSRLRHPGAARRANGDGRHRVVDTRTAGLASADADVVLVAADPSVWCRPAPVRPVFPARCCTSWAGGPVLQLHARPARRPARLTSSWSRRARLERDDPVAEMRDRRPVRSCAAPSLTCSAASRPRSTRIRPITSSGSPPTAPSPTRFSSRRCWPATSIGAPTTRRTCSRAPSRAASTARS